MRIKVMVVIVVALLTVTVFLVMNRPQEPGAAKVNDDYSGEVYRVSERDISPAAGSLSVVFTLVPTLEYAAEATPVVTAKSDDPGVIRLGQTEDQDPTGPFHFPVEIISPGHAVVTVDYRLFCCNREDRAACFFKEGRLVIPVTVSEGGNNEFYVSRVID